MPRGARKKGESGIYHAMLRGINKQTIFEDEEDYEKFRKVLKDCKKISNCKIYAYCLMGNHIHLLLKEENEELDVIFKRIGSRYVYWYNNKYYRTGHLFQDRYKSEPVDTDSYFLTVLRYIHQNPVKARLCDDAALYRWSSYSDYAHQSGITDTGLALAMFSEDSNEAFLLFEKFMSENEKAICLDIEEINMITDIKAWEIIHDLSGASTPTEFQALVPAKRNEILSILKEHGLSIRRIVRLTGIGFGIVRKG